MDTWYARLECAAHLSAGAAEVQPRLPVSPLRRVRDFLPEPLPTGTRVPAAPETEAQRLGRAWHSMLEQGGAASIDAIAREHALTREQAERVAAAAVRVRARLPQFFVAASEAELELVAADGELLRVDRLIEHDDALWIIDFKWRISDAERAQYEAQVRRYAQVLRSIRRDKPVRTALVTTDGEVIEVAV
jgi:ATP-dependent helicase/nuclease subunit A